MLWAFYNLAIFLIASHKLLPNGLWFSAHEYTFIVSNFCEFFFSYKIVCYVGIFQTMSNVKTIVIRRNYLLFITSASKFKSESITLRDMSQKLFWNKILSDIYYVPTVVDRRKYRAPNFHFSHQHLVLRVLLFLQLRMEHICYMKQIGKRWSIRMMIRRATRSEGRGVLGRILPHPNFKKPLK